MICLTTIFERIAEAFDKPMIEYNLLDNIIVCGSLILLVLIIGTILNLILKGRNK